ncbi:MAG: D-alanyl-D-alanine carboxypeptidase [Bacilli bacterium]|nr:D-alanyl-D-alanine carboxypeptidase [Bacilli bacterium]
MKRIRVWTIILFILFLLPVNIYSLDFDIYSKNAILYNTKENKIMYEKNSTDKVSIASLTKITTGIVALENIKNLDDKVTLTEKDFEGLAEANAAVAGFRIGQEVTYRDLMYGLLLPSGADAAQALTRNISGSNEKFVKLMNEKAKELKLENTHYANPTGLDDPNNYSTVKDVFTVFQYALNNEDFKEMVTTMTYVTSDGSITFKSTFTKAAALSIDYIKGGKTGTTGDAGLCLASIANYDNTDFILITTGAKYVRGSLNNFVDHKMIYEFVRANYDYQEVVNPEDVLVTLKTEYLKEDTIDFKSPKKIVMYLDKDFNKKKLFYKYSGTKVITRKNKNGEKLGKVDIIYDKEKLASIDIVLKDKPRFSIIKYLLAHKLIVGIVLLVLIIFIFRTKKHKKIKIKVKKKKRR